MFIEFKSSEKETIVINTEKIVYFIAQPDGTLIYFENSTLKEAHCKTVMEDYKRVKEILNVKGTAKKEVKVMRRSN